MDIMKEYRTGIRKLHRLIVKDADDSEEGERIREDMLDNCWNKMTPEQHEEVRRFSERLYVLQDLRNHVKELSETQKKAKLFRKMKYRKANPEAFEEWYKEHGGLNSIMKRKAMITAAINLRHELRGSPYRHEIKENGYWARCYVDAEKELVEKFRVVKDAAKYKVWGCNSSKHVPSAATSHQG